MAESDGGALYSNGHCNITIGQYSKVMFVSNSAMQYGGAIYCDRHSDATLKSNTAEHGGAVCASQSIIKLANNSVVMLRINKAIKNGRISYFINKFTVTFDYGSSIKFVNNSAHRYGGALYSEVNHEGLSN